MPSTEKSQDLRVAGKSSHFYHSGAAHNPSGVAKKLLLAASAGALAAAAPSLVFAQALPAGCTDGNNDIAENGETVTCLPPPATIDEVVVDADDITINVGNASTPAAINGYPSAFNGIYVEGNGTTTINVTNAGTSVYGYYAGVYWNPQNSGATANLVLDNEGSISSYDDHGVELRHTGPGNITITNSGSIAAGGGTGLFVRSGSGDVYITSTGTIAGASDPGLDLQGSGAMTLSIANASGSGVPGGGAGARVSGASAIDFTSSGLIAGGIYAGNFGSAIFSVNNVTGVSVFDIGAATTSLTVETVTPGNGSFDDIEIDVDAASTAVIDFDIHDADTIILTNFGGSLSLSSTGTVDSVFCVPGGGLGGPCGGGPLTLNLNNVAKSGAVNKGAIVLEIPTTGADDISVTVDGVISGAGVYIDNAGAGDTVIDVNNLNIVAADDSNGIVINHAATATGDIVISSAGLLSVEQTDDTDAAIVAFQYGSGGVEIDVNDVTAIDEIGVEVYSDASAGDISVTAAGAVSATNRGVEVRSGGTGAATTISVNDVMSTADDAVYARVEGTDLSITATGTVTGGQDGVEARNQGTGALSIEVDNAGGTNRFGVFARNAVGTDLSVTATGTVIGGTSGVVAANYGSGNVNIAVHNVTGVGADGIYTFGYGASLSVTATGDIVGNNRGILANNFGSGDSTITLGSSAYVHGQGAEGIYALTTQATANLIVQGSSGDIVGATEGLNLTTMGADIAVQNLDSVTGQSGSGIYADSDTGNITISDIGTITANGAGGRGIFADTGSAGGAGNISIQGVGLVGGVNSDGGAGIFARSQFGANRGDVNIGGVTPIGDVTSTNSEGISATGRNITINVQGDVNAYDDGIFAAGDGAVAITTGNVTSSDLGGVFGRTLTGGSTLSITSTGSVMASTYGVYGDNEGSGDLTINVVDVTGGPTYYGIIANNAGANLSITATGAVSGGAEGIVAINLGSGAEAINAANVTGTTSDGIYAYNAPSATDLSITGTGAIAGGAYGIYAVQLGAGAATINVADSSGTNGDGVYVFSGVSSTGLSITATGDVAGLEGIYAFHVGSGPVTVAANNVMALVGGDDAIDASNYGSGSLSVVTTGTVVSAEDDGVDAINTGTDLSITTSGPVMGADVGIVARNYGLGSTTISATGDVTGLEGIYAIHVGSGPMTITSNNVTALSGGDDAIDAMNYGSGALSIVTTGTVTSAEDDGIDAINTGTDLSITTSGSVTGFEGGIEAYNYGSGATTISVSGPVEGQTEDGVLTVTVNGADITIDAGGSVTGMTAAIRTDSGVAPGDPVDDSVTLKAGSSASGDIRLLAGADTFNDGGGAFTKTFGGAGVDTANFDDTGHDVSGAGSNVDSIRQVELFNFNSGESGLTGTHTDVTATMIADGATLNARDGAVLSGDVTNNGVLNIGNSPGVFTITGDFTQSSTGLLPIEISDTDHDLLIVSGDVSLDGAVQIIPLAGLSIGTATRTIIDGGTGLSGTFASVNSGLLISNVINYDAAGYDVSATTTVNTASSLTGLTRNQRNVGDNLVGMLADSSLDQDLVDLVGALGNINDIASLGEALDDLHPEGLDAGLKMVTTSQSRFVDLVMSQSQPGQAPGPVRVASLASGPVSSTRSRDGARAWAGFQVVGVSNDGRPENVQLNGESLDFAAGLSGVRAGPLRLGFAGGYSDFDGETGGVYGEDFDGHLYHIALSGDVDFNFGGGRATLANVASYAGGENEITMNRLDLVAGEPASQRGGANVSSFDWRSRLTLDGERSWPIKPHVQAGITLYDEDAFMIGRGASPSLAIDELDMTRGMVGIGATYEHQWRDNLFLRAQATGTHYFGDVENVFSSRFAAAPTGSDSFLTYGDKIERQIQMEADFTYMHDSGFMVSFGGFGEVGDINVYGAQISLSKRF